MIHRASLDKALRLDGITWCGLYVGYPTLEECEDSLPSIQKRDPISMRGYQTIDLSRTNTQYIYTEPSGL